MKLRKAIWAASVLVLIIFMAGEVYAFGLRVSEARIYLEVEPGKTYEGFIDVARAQGTNEAPVEVLINDWKYDDERDVIEDLPFNSQPDSSSSWINFSPSSFYLDDETPNVKIRYAVNVPPDIDLPEYYSIIYLKTKAPMEVKENTIGVQMQAKISVLFKITVKGVGKVSGELKDFNVTENTDEGFFELNYQVRNTGNTILVFEGNYSVIDAEGNLYGRGSVDRTPISKDKEKSFTTKWYGDLEEGEYDFILTLEGADVFWPFKGAVKLCVT